MPGMWKARKMKCANMYIFMKKLTPKQRGEAVTKGFLVDNEYVTKSSLEEILENKLKPYVTKDYLDIKLREQSAEFRQHVESLMEHQINQIQIFMEQMDERYVLRREWKVVG
jgi:hypothetical protein